MSFCEFTVKEALKCKHSIQPNGSNYTMMPFIFARPRPPDSFWFISMHTIGYDKDKTVLDDSGLEREAIGTENETRRQRRQGLVTTVRGQLQRRMLLRGSWEGLGTELMSSGRQNTAQKPKRCSVKRMYINFHSRPSYKRCPRLQLVSFKLTWRVTSCTIDWLKCIREFTTTAWVNTKYDKSWWWTLYEQIKIIKVYQLKIHFGALKCPTGTLAQYNNYNMHRRDGRLHTLRYDISMKCPSWW